MKYIMLTISAFLLGISNAYAKGDLARQEPIVVHLTMSEFKYEPNHLEFETGKLYRLIIRNVGNEKHEVDSASISHLAYTRKLEVLDKKGNLVAEFKGVPAEIEVGAGYEVEWWFVPIATTDGAEEFSCLLPGHYEAGMFGTIAFK